MALLAATVTAPAQAQAAVAGTTASAAVAPAGLDLPIIGGPLDPVLTVLPVPGITGLGSIVQQGGGDYQCVNALDAIGQHLCDPIPLSSLGLTETVLQAVPADGYQFDGWASCPEASGDLCTIDAGLLNTLVQPIAQFVPIPGLPAPTEPPTVTITAAPEGTTRQTSATFAFTSDEQGTTFTCQLTGGAGQQAGFTTCESPKTYANLSSSGTPYVFTVKGKGAAGEGVATRTWRIDTEAPQTRLTDAPRSNSWLLRDFASFEFDSDETGVTYRCGLDGRLSKCPGRQKSYFSLSSRTHIFAVSATDKAGNVDLSPARRTFTVPKNNNTLKHSKGWVKRSGSGHFLGTYSQTQKKGAWVSTRASSIKRIALVVTKGRGQGTVKVFLGKKMLTRVSLQATKTRHQRVVPVKTFTHKKHGTIRVVVASRHKTVRIEGLGIASR